MTKRITNWRKGFDQLREACRWTDPELLPFIDQVEAAWDESAREMFRLWRLEDEVKRLKAERVP